MPIKLFYSRFHPTLKNNLILCLSSWARRTKKTFPRGYLLLYKHLKLYQVIVRLGGGFEIQFTSLPEDISDLVQQIITVRTIDIQWGGRPTRAYRKSGLKVESGDWDLLQKEPIESYLQSDIYCRSIWQLFVEGKAITETEQYIHMTRRLAAGKNPKGCKNLAEINECFSNLIQAYRTIKAEGYKTQIELKSSNPIDEIMVYVDRNGELHKQQGSGHHRLALARLLNIKVVPVCVLGVHKLWAQKCYEQYGGDITFALNQGLKNMSHCE